MIQNIQLSGDCPYSALYRRGGRGGIVIPVSKALAANMLNNHHHYSLSLPATLVLNSRLPKTRLPELKRFVYSILSLWVATVTAQPHTRGDSWTMDKTHDQCMHHSPWAWHCWQITSTDITTKVRERALVIPISLSSTLSLHR